MSGTTTATENALHQAHAMEKDGEIITVRPQGEILTKQQLPYFVGISASTAGTKVLSMNLVVIPPGSAAEPHLHAGQETAIFIVKGDVETRYGPGLRKKTINHEGDFLFIPPYVSHQPVNLSATEPVYAIVARDDPNEQEHVFLYDPSQAEGTA